MNAATKEALLAMTRDAYAQGEAMLRSFSGSDQADSELYFGLARVYRTVALGFDTEEALAIEDARWRAYAAEQARRVEAAPKIKRGPSSGHSAISHRWVSPDAFAAHMPHARQMIATAMARGEGST